MAHSIKLMIVEDVQAISASLIEYFEQQEDIELVAYVNSIESMNKLQSVSPDVILMDIMLPGINGIQGVTHALKKWPHVRIVMYSVLEESEAIYTSLQNGALAYITKDISLSSAKEAIITVYNGGSYMNAAIARKVVNYFQKSSSIREKLTDKEWAVALGIKNGLSYKMIAAEHELSVDGVRFHIQRIYRKLNINSRGELTNMMVS
jgi:DNA-binding NarL/FixJ family response regulator